MGAWGADTGWGIEPKLPELPPAEIDPGGLESLAVRQRADLEAARAEVVVAAQGLGLSRYSVLGDVGVTGHFERDADGTTTVGPGAEVPLPIFNQGQTAVATAQARLRQSRKRYAALAVEVRAQVRRARSRVAAAR